MTIVQQSCNSCVIFALAEELEGNIVDHKRSLELLELQEMLSWPPVTALDPDAYIPEVHTNST